MARRLKTIASMAGDPNNPFTESSWRWMVFRANENGLAAAGAVVRVGRRVLIDEDGFDRWIEAQNPGLQTPERRADS